MKLADGGHGHEVNQDLRAVPDVRPYGPFSTERAARAAAHEVTAPPGDFSVLDAEGNRTLLYCALGRAGVDLAAFDMIIAEWLVGYEDSTVSVIAGWVARAYAEGQAAAVRDAQ